MRQIIAKEIKRERVREGEKRKDMGKGKKKKTKEI